MDSRIATTLDSRKARFARTIGVAFLASSLVCSAASAQTSSAPEAVAETPASPVTNVCPAVLSGESPLPNVAAALAARKKLRILTFGASPSRIGTHGGYAQLIESMLERTLKGTDVVMINRGVSGELAADAAIRMKTQVALEEPELVLWQVGTNDALASVPTDGFILTIKNQIDWLKRRKVDVVLVGLQFANEMLRDAHYIDVRDSLRRVAAQENVIVIRFFEAMQILNKVEAGAAPLAVEEVEQSQAGYNCLAQYVARAITLGLFAKSMPKPPTLDAPTLPVR